MPGAGDLEYLVTFQSRDLDANGDRLGEFADRVTTWAAIDWQRGSETAVTNRLQGLQPATLTVWDCTETGPITAAYRAVIVDGPGMVGTQFNITARAPARDRGFVNLMAVAGGATG